MGTRVLSFHYTLTNKEDQEIDSSRDAEPFPIMEGARQVVPALEEALFSMKAGEKKVIDLSAEKAYGHRQEALLHEVPRDKLPGDKIEVGVQFRGGDEPDSLLYTVTKIEGDTVYLDGNHPLAGVHLIFDVEVIDIREATPEEIEHGHAHGPHGHHHH